MMSLVATGLPFNVNVPLIGKLSIRTAFNVCNASGSIKAKSAVVKVSVVSSSVVLVMSALLGGLLVPTLTISVAVSKPPLPSEIV